MATRQPLIGHIAFSLAEAAEGPSSPTAVRKASLDAGKESVNLLARSERRRLPGNNPNCEASVEARVQRSSPAGRFFTIREVSSCFHVSTRTARRWISSGALTAHRIGRLVRVSETDLAAFVALRRDP